MAIITNIPNYNAPQEVLLNLYPDQFIGEGLTIDSNRRLTDDNGNVLPMPRQNTSVTTKRSPQWWKINMDYFYTIALAQYNWGRDKIVRNYELMKGHLTASDFYLEGPVMSLMDEVMNDVDLPAYVQHYPILNPPVNTMVGEKSKRPDISRPKAMDDDSKSEEAQYYTQIYQEYINQKINQKVAEQLKQQGVDISHMEEFNQQVQELTADKVKEYMVSYTSEAEIWATNMIQALKVEFNMKEHFENGFRDLLICNKEFFHNYQDKSRTGFKSEKVNPKNVGWLTTPDKKYIKDAYAAWVIEIMELSEILDKFDITEEETEHLRKFAMQAFFPYSRTSNLYTNDTGVESIKYNAYDPLVLQERNRLEAQLTADGNQRQDGLFGNAAPSVGTFGNRFVVVTSYWKSKRKVGLLTYVDKDGNIQSEEVDDTYKDKSHPQQLAIEWKWENQWYKGVKIGQDIYYVEPLEIIDYCPIIGVVHEIENTISTSLVDLMKPFQTLYNVCMNQLYRLLEKEKGKVLLMNKRHIPVPKGGTYEDSLEMWERDAEETGVVWIDDSPDNMKGASGWNQTTVVDWTLSQQMQSRYELAVALKNECWELVGINRERTGGVAASQTATGTNTAISQSYAQTEPYFVQQEYLENQQLQCMLDIAQYLECKNPESTLSFIDSEGGNVFCKIQTASGLKNRDIKLFMTSRSEDQTFRNDLKQLSQAALQNGASLYEVALMQKETSTRKILDMLKQLKDKNDAMQQQAQQMQQQDLQLKQQQAQAEQQRADKEHADNIQVETYKIDTDSNTKITVARIMEGTKIAIANQSQEGPDHLDIIAQAQKTQDSIYKRDIEQMRMAMDKQQQALAQQNQNKEGMRKDRKLDLEEQGLELQKQDLKLKAKQIAKKPAAKK
jgi:hypothetical protein